MQVLVISLLYIIRYIESSSPTKIIHQQYQPCTILARKKGHGQSTHGQPYLLWEFPHHRHIHRHHLVTHGSILTVATFVFPGQSCFIYKELDDSEVNDLSFLLCFSYYILTFYFVKLVKSCTLWKLWMEHHQTAGCIIFFDGRHGNHTIKDVASVSALSA